MTINISFPKPTSIEPLYKESFGEVLLQYPCDSSTSCIPYKVSLAPGVYKFELWGAQGGDSRIEGNKPNLSVGSGGKGAYTSGIIDLKTSKLFYFYLGGKGEDQWSMEPNISSKGGFNGGGDGGIDYHDDQSPESCSGGGGASDIRLDIDDLKSRIMVAAGGGGSESWILPTGMNKYNGGEGGALKGFSYNPLSIPGNQTHGFSFGNGVNGPSFIFNLGGSMGGGGGGYYGGNIAPGVLTSDLSDGGGAGGSSFVSGFKGCDAVSGSSLSIVHTNQPIHYSRIAFRKPEMKSGKDLFSSPVGGNEKGHLGNGFARITFLKNGTLDLCTMNKKSHFYGNANIFVLLFISFLK